MATLCAGGMTLRNQINARWPNRDRRSDGWIGDRAHAARISDHNPDAHGIVHAIDIDENMGVGTWRNGKTAQRLANQLIAYAASDLPGAKRLKYVVYEDRIASGTYKPTWWKWRGKGYGHTAHIHVSFNNLADDDHRLFPLPILALNKDQQRRWAKDLWG
jgi:hypothetical protein